MRPDVRKLTGRSLVALSFLVLFPLASADLYFRAYGPRGVLKVRTTSLSWECWADDAKSIEGFEASLNGKALTTKYDPETRKLTAETGRLEPGTYQAELAVKYRGGNAHRKQWTLEVSPDALESLPPPDQAQKEGLAAANDLRTKLGLGAYSMDDRANAASLAHARYLHLNNVTGHTQTPGKPGFVGRTHKERLEAFGFVGSSSENIAFGMADPQEAMQGLIDAPYHRLPFLTPGKLSFGCGQVGKVMAMAVSTSEEPGTVVYPYDGQVNVPRLWDKPEYPDPLAIHSASGRVVGYPITAVFFTGAQAAVKIEAVSLTGPAGEVACFVNTPANDKNLANAVFLIPQTPLASGTNFTAYVKASIQRTDGPETVEKRWSFRTQ